MFIGVAANELVCVGAAKPKPSLFVGIADVVEFPKPKSAGAAGAVGAAGATGAAGCALIPGVSKEPLVLIIVLPSGGRLSSGSFVPHLLQNVKPGLNSEPQPGSDHVTDHAPITWLIMH